MSKTTYQNFLTVPGSTSDTISDGQNVGGDIVTNFKKIADAVHPDGIGGLVVGGENQDLESIYSGSSSAHGAQGLHILNNNVLGYAYGGGPAHSVQKDAFPARFSSKKYQRGPEEGDPLRLRQQNGFRLRRPGQIRKFQRTANT